VGTGFRRAAPVETWRSAPELHSHAARGNEEILEVSTGLLDRNILDSLFIEALH